MHSSGAFASCERGRMSMHGVIARSEATKRNTPPSSSPRRRTIQYSRDVVIGREAAEYWIPREPGIRPAEGRTGWRDMTAVCVSVDCFASLAMTVVG
jgi:hypothetical protein